jgi:hypothetical protein
MPRFRRPEQSRMSSGLRVHQFSVPILAVPAACPVENHRVVYRSGIGLHIVGRTDDEPAILAIDIEFLPNLRHYVRRGAEGNRLLHIDAAPEGQFVAKLSL